MQEFSLSLCLHLDFCDDILLTQHQAKTIIWLLKSHGNKYLTSKAAGTHNQMICFVISKRQCELQSVASLECF